MSRRIRNIEIMIFFLIPVLVHIPGSEIRSQGIPSEVIEGKLSEYLAENPEERLFLHISKSFIISGETLWFRIYHYSNRDNMPIALSKVAYVELLNDVDRSVLKVKVSITKSGGSGYLEIPSTLPTGRYQVIAYTRWMRNFDHSHFFSHPIDVINPFTSTGLKQRDSSKFDLQFFPEGGHLVDGLNSRIAFKGVDQYGEGVDFEGAVLTGSGDTLLRFIPNQFGMGSFEIVPSKAQDYMIIVRNGVGRQQSFDFPDISESGYTMMVTRTDPGYSVSVKARGQNINESTEIHLAVISGNALVSLRSAQLNAGSATIELPIDQFKEGVNQLTVINTAGIPVCERKVFLFPENQMEIRAQIPDHVPGPREAVEIELETVDSNGNPLKSDLSVSVYLDPEDLSTSNASIKSYLWLLSELKGRIQNPDYYFANVDEQKMADMDYLMLTQGWSRYEIRQIVAGESSEPTLIPEFTDMILSGTIRSVNTREPLTDEVIVVSVLSANPQFFATRSQAGGKFTLGADGIYGRSELIFQNDVPEEQIEVELENSFEENYQEENNWDLTFMLSEELSSFILDQSVNMQVGRVFEPGPEIIESVQEKFYGVPDASYPLDDYTRFPVMEEVMREYVYNVFVRRNEGKFIFKVVDRERNEILEGDPLILLDGIPLNEANDIMEVDPLSIEQIDVIHKNYYYGPLNCSGIVAFYSYESNDLEIPGHRNTKRYEFQGYQVRRSFYTPVYDTPEKRISRIPDFRNQLHWDPQVETDGKGKATVKFYTSDFAGSYRIKIQGISENGMPSSFSGKIEVKSPTGE